MNHLRRRLAEAEALIATNRATVTPVRSGNPPGAGLSFPPLDTPSPGPQYATAAASAAPPVGRPLPVHISCMDPCITCSTGRKPHQRGTMQWLCEGCGLRGDLQADHPANKYLQQVAIAKLAPAAAASSASSVSSQGQPKPDTHDTDGAVLTKLEREFRDRLRDPPTVYPTFALTGCTPTEQEATVAAAFLLGRDALGGSDTVLPSPHLVRLIQSGKMKHIGWAIPKPVSRDARDDNTSAAFTLDFGGRMTAQSRDVTSPPVVASLSQFMDALTSTILPSLAAQPLAQQEWLALARSLIYLDATYSWPIAATYCDRILNERIPQGKGFALPSQAIMLTLLSKESAAIHSHPKQGVNGPRDAKKPSGGSGSGGGNREQQQQFCHNFNKPHGCKSRDCRYKHACSGCGTAGQPAHSHTSCYRKGPTSDAWPSAAAAAGEGKGGKGGDAK